MLRIALTTALVVLVAAVLGLQLVPPEFPRDNPPVVAPLQAPPPVREVLRGGCYDCHSHETSWPWYSWVAPASWLVTQDVAAGRSRMNFSTWGDLGDAFRRRYARKIVERIEKGEM
ncbi:MAG: heme-binding domain-containing protein, partial [Acidobacteriota bacterium]